MKVIDPAPAIARQVGRLLDQHALANDDDAPQGSIQYLTTGKARRLKRLLPVLIGEQGVISTLNWSHGKLSRPRRSKQNGS